ncbi:MAG: radical SAM family heme chaperone HemW [Candidatus Riflebacteria bacterium]|nr:radical SAM family heme chaperone HemW [Candidatus Riflebacteria bacterium]
MPSAEGLYIHVPFCLNKCNYCAFYSVIPRPEMIEAYLENLKKELLEKKSFLKPEITIFIGGGNPTAPGSEFLTRLMKILSPVLSEHTISEFSIETNPETFDKKSAKILKHLPKLRINVGIQRFQNSELKTIGRNTCSEFNKLAFENVFSITENAGIDVILGIPGCKSIKNDLGECLMNYQFKHISAYFLSIEENTELHKMHLAGKFPDTDDIDASELFEISDLLKQNGFKHYEISNFCTTGRECRHNLQYWHGLDYVGIGPSAVSTINGVRFSNPPDIHEWLLSKNIIQEKIDRNISITEYIFLRLRLLCEGFSIKDFEKKFGSIPDEIFQAIQSEIAAGNLERNSDSFMLSKNGLTFANQVISRIIP